MSHGRRTVVALCAAAAYGFALGSSHSLEASLHNVVKFPLLLGVTALVCALGYTVTGKFLMPQLETSAVLRLTGALFIGIAYLVASLSPVLLLVGLTFDDRGNGGLGEYALFLELNLLLVALSGGVALLHQFRALIAEVDTEPWRATLLLTVWLGLSAAVGGQGSFYLRPFIGVPWSRGEPRRFFLGGEPTPRGAHNFFEVVWFAFEPPEFEREAP